MTEPTIGDKFLAFTYGPAMLAFLVINMLGFFLNIIAGSPYFGIFFVLALMNYYLYRFGAKYRAAVKNDLLELPPKQSKVKP